MAAEGPSVLPDHAHVPAGAQQRVQGHVPGAAPVFAVEKQHVGALGPADPDAGEVIADKPAGVVHILRQHLAQLVHPDFAFGAVSAHERVHGQDVHVVVVALGGNGPDPVAEGLVVDDVVAAHQTRQIEGLAGSVQGHGAVSGVVADRLGGNVAGAVQDQVGPDLVGDDGDVVGPVDLHGLLNFPALPDPAAGVVGRAEHGRMDAVLFELAVHVGKVHAPDAVLVQAQGRVDDAVAGVGERTGEADVGGAVEQHRVAGGGAGAHGGHQTAQNAVFVADGVCGQAGDAVALLVPAADGVEVLLPGGEVAVGRMGGPADDGLGDGGAGGEVHVGHPHGDGVKAVFGRAGGRTAAKTVHRQSVHPPAVQNRSKIVSHTVDSFLCVSDTAVIARARATWQSAPQPCHCEERSDAAIRPCAGSSDKEPAAIRTDCHGPYGASQ